MKKIITLFILLVLVISAYSQAPQKMSYQAVIRDFSSNLVTNTTIGIRISILKDSPTGTSVYSETHSATTNANGLVNLEVGAGTVVSGTFSGIDWSTGVYFIKTEADIYGGSSYSITATTQLLSVPYALFSKAVDYSSILNKPAGSNVGDMQYWNGSQWIPAPVGLAGQYLQLAQGNIPTWTGNAYAKISTTPVSSISQTSASTGGNILSDGGASVTAKGVCWNTTGNPTVFDNNTSDGSGTGVFTSALSGLIAGTSYYIRAYAINSVGTSYGEQVNFITTKPSAPIDGLVAYYPFNGNANDESDNGHDGVVNGATLSTDKDGNSNQAYSFNGTSDFIKIAGALPVTNSFTISFWANCESSTGYNNILCDGSSNYGGNDFLINFRANNIGIRADKNNLPLNYEDSSPGELTGLDIINKWVHVVWVMNPSASSIYLNGVLLATINQAGTNEGYHDDYSFIGARQVWGSPDYFFKGKLDEIMIYNRSLTESEITSIYNSTGTTIPIPSISTANITEITANSASSGGTITSDGGATISSRGVCWNTTGNPTISDSKSSDDNGTGAFTSSISGLTVGTTYYIRAYATNSAGTFYGNQLSFVTSSIPQITWSVITTDNNEFGHISFGNKVFIAVTDNGCASTNNSAYVSSDYGLTWVKKATPGSTDMSGIAYNPNNKIFVASHRCYENDRSYSYSTDNGNTWTPILQSPATYRYDIYRVKDYFFSCIVYNSVDKSADGINWSHLNFGGTIPYSVSAYSDKFGLYYANSYPWYAGNTDKFYTSPDATNWTARDTLARYQFVAGNDVVLSYLSTSPKPFLRRSVDGINFSLINSLPNINSIPHMTFMNGLFWATINVTGVNTQKVMVSHDGTSWEVLNTPAVDTYAVGIAIGFDPAINKNVIIISCSKGMFLRGVIND